MNTGLFIGFLGLAALWGGFVLNPLADRIGMLLAFVVSVLVISLGATVVVVVS